MSINDLKQKKKKATLVLVYSVHPKDMRLMLLRAMTVVL